MGNVGRYNCRLCLSDFIGNKDLESIMVMGTTGNFDRIARIKPPFLKGNISSVSDQVLSGYIKLKT